MFTMSMNVFIISKKDVYNNEYVYNVDECLQNQWMFIIFMNMLKCQHV